MLCMQLYVSICIYLYLSVSICIYLYLYVTNRTNRPKRFGKIRANRDRIIVAGRTELQYVYGMDSTIFQAICDHISTCKDTIKKCCELYGVSSTAFYDYLYKNGPGAQEAYKLARERQIGPELDDMRTVEIECAERIIQLPETHKRLGNALVQAYKLRIDGIKWRASKLLPREYGDTINQRISDADGNALSVVFNVPRPEKKEKRDV